MTQSAIFLFFSNENWEYLLSGLYVRFNWLKQKVNIDRQNEKLWWKMTLAGQFSMSSAPRCPGRWHYRAFVLFFCGIFLIFRASGRWRGRWPGLRLFENWNLKVEFQITNSPNKKYTYDITHRMLSESVWP